MKKTQFRLSNNFGENIDISLEPVGTIFELQDEKSIIFDISANESPVIDLQINKENGKLYFSIWPEKGAYEVIS